MNTHVLNTYNISNNDIPKPIMRSILLQSMNIEFTNVEILYKYHKSTLVKKSKIKLNILSKH